MTIDNRICIEPFISALRHARDPRNLPSHPPFPFPALVEFDEEWKVQDETTYVMEGAALAPHDFALTPSYYVFMENQMSMDLFPYGNF